MFATKASHDRRSFRMPRAIIAGAIVATCCATNVFAQTQGVVNGYNVSVRTGPSASASVIKFLNKGDAVSVESQEGDYFRVAIDGSEDLYIGGEYLDIWDEEALAAFAKTNGAPTLSVDSGESSNSATVLQTLAGNHQYGVVNSSDGLNIRSDPSEEAEILMSLPYGTAVDVITVWDNWIKVHYDDETGYMAREFLDLQQGARPAGRSESGGSKADAVIAYARQFMGTPYRWAGTNLNKGVDCSGFVYSVYKHFGITLNRTSGSMPANGAKIQRANLQKGDLVFFDTSGANNGRISHVGMYIGDGQFIHSSSSRRSSGVTISSLNESTYSRQFVTACRILS